MTPFLLGFVVFALAFAGLGAGLLLGRGPLRASCGGDPAVRRCQACSREDAP